MIEFLTVSLIFFFLGRYSLSPTDVEKVKKFVKSFKKDRVGPVRRPTAEQLRKRGTIAEETDEAMSETLGKIVDDTPNMS